MPVRRDRHGDVLVLTLDRAAKRNAMDAEMVAALSAGIDELEDDPGLRVGVLTGGATVFSAGSDLHVTTPDELRTVRGGEYGLVRRVRTKPLIAAVEGPALGGGLEMVLSCDLVVAGEDAVLGLPEVARGVIASCGGLFRAPQALPANVGAELLLLGEPLSSVRAHELGLVNRLVPSGDALVRALELAERVAGNAPVPIRETLRALARARAGDEDAGWAITDEAVAVVVASDDAREGRRAFFERRPPRWQGD